MLRLKPKDIYYPTVPGKSTKLTGVAGEMVPKGQVLGLQKRVDELERALGRKALIEWAGRGVLRQLQERLRLSGMPGNIRGGETPGAKVDRGLQSASPPQRLGDALTGRVLCGMDSQKQKTTCPKLGGAVQVLREAYEREIPSVLSAVCPSLWLCLFTCGLTSARRRP